MIDLKDPKYQTKLKIIAVVVIVLAISLLGGSFFGGSADKKKELSDPLSQSKKIQLSSISVEKVNDSEIEKDKWRASSRDTLNELIVDKNKTNKKLMDLNAKIDSYSISVNTKIKKIEAMLGDVKGVKESVEQFGMKVDKVSKKNDRLLEDIKKLLKNRQLPKYNNKNIKQPGSNKPGKVNHASPPGANNKTNPSDGNKKSKPVQAENKKKKKSFFVAEPSTLSFSADEPAKETEKLSSSLEIDKGVKTVSSSEESDLSYIPANTVIPVRLIQGFNAFTSPDAQANPHPVLVKVTGDAILPNGGFFDLKGCFVGGDGYGEFSSERAYIRTNKLSCVDREGQAIEVDIQAYFSGEDGMAGVRGKIISKKGRALAHAMLAGFAEGAGKLMGQSANVTSISPLGQTQSVDTSKLFEAGMWGGLQKDAELLSRYYIDMANSTFDVIEIHAGRNIDLIVREGFYTKPLNI